MIKDIQLFKRLRLCTIDKSKSVEAQWRPKIEIHPESQFFMYISYCMFHLDYILLKHIQQIRSKLQELSCLTLRKRG